MMVYNTCPIQYIAITLQATTTTTNAWATGKTGSGKREQEIAQKLHTCRDKTTAHRDLVHKHLER